MKIIIAGAGEVGTHLAKMLSKEKHTIMLLDEDSEKTKALEATHDILSVVGKATSLDDLREAQVPDADLFIAVTPYESTNITACLLANNLGAQKTLARIDNQEYLLPKNREFFKSMGVDSLIYPEMLAANEILNSLKEGWVRQYIELSNGALTLIATKIRRNAPLCDQILKVAFEDNKDIRVAVIKRGTETILPTGDERILDKDIVYFITTKDGKEKVRKISGKEEFAIDNIIFLGGSRIGIKAIQSLKGKNIKVIEQDREKTYRVIENTEDALVINGDGRDLSLLKEEEIEQFDAFVALTGNSETNILACLAAKQFGVKRTVAEVENMDYIPMAEQLDIGSIINKKIIAASHIYQLIFGNGSVRCLTLAEVELIELTAEEGSSVTLKSLSKLKLPKNTVIGGVVRGKEGFVAIGETKILAGDNVIVFCGEDSLRKVRKLFKA